MFNFLSSPFGQDSYGNLLGDLYISYLDNIDQNPDYFEKIQKGISGV